MTMNTSTVGADSEELMMFPNIQGIKTTFAKVLHQNTL